MFPVEIIDSISVIATVPRSFRDFHSRIYPSKGMHFPQSTPLRDSCLFQTGGFFVGSICPPALHTRAGKLVPPKNLSPTNQRKNVGTLPEIHPEPAQMHDQRELGYGEDCEGVSGVEGEKALTVL